MDSEGCEGEEEEPTTQSGMSLDTALPHVNGLLEYPDDALLADKLVFRKLLLYQGPGDRLFGSQRNIYSSPTLSTSS